MYDYPAWAPQGWQYPICKRVYSPDTAMCIYCGNMEVTTSTKLEIKTAVATSPDGWIEKV